MRYSVGARDEAILAVCRGASFAEAAGLIGASDHAVGNWWRDTVGMPVRRHHLPVADPLRMDARPGRGLRLAERIEIQAGVREGVSQREIARRIGRDQSVVSRELARHRDGDGQYRASTAELGAQRARRRPKPFKLITNTALAARVESWIDDGWSPKLIADVLERDHPADKTGESHSVVSLPTGSSSSLTK